MKILTRHLPDARQQAAVGFWSFWLTAISFCLFSFYTEAQSPSVELLTSGTNSSLRGLSVVNDNIIWVSGSNGTVGKSSTGGKNWKWYVVKGFENAEFRDIEAFDANTAVIMSIGEPAYILRTTNGGESWKVVYENYTNGVFLDAMEFWNEKAGIVVGDPIEGRFLVSRTFDGGATWKDIPFDKRPMADSGEACFAASGTNIRVLKRDEAVFVSGGSKSRLFKRNQIIDLPIVQGTATSGTNSIAVWNGFSRKGGRKLIVVGGDFKSDSASYPNCAISFNAGKNWMEPKTPPLGYRSCVEFVSRNDVFACGLSGVDYSSNSGKDWSLVSSEGFHVCRIAKRGSSIFLAGNDGKIAKINWR